MFDDDVAVVPVNFKTLNLYLLLKILLFRNFKHETLHSYIFYSNQHYIKITF